MRNYCIVVIMLVGLYSVVTSVCAQTSLKGWQLNEFNTGLNGVGIDRDTLPLYSLKPDAYGWLWPDRGSVIREKRIENPICLAAGDITIERCWIRLTVDPGAGMPAMTDLDFNRMKACSSVVTVRDCDIDGTALADPNNNREGFPGVGSVGIWQRNNIYGVGCGWYTSVGNGVPILVENNYIHLLRTGTVSHDDGLTIRGRCSPATLFRNNRINANTIHCTGALFLQATFGFLDSIYIEGNLLEGNGYNLILEWNRNGYGRIWAKNNRFNPVGYGTGYVAGGGGWLGWQDMYLNDSTKVDNVGSVVDEPKAVTVKALTAPANLSAQLKSANHVVLAWAKNGGDRNGFRIERAVDGGRFIGIDMKDSMVTQYNDSGLDIGSYSYRVAAYCKDGISEYSNIASAVVTSVRAEQLRGKRYPGSSTGIELSHCFSGKYSTQPQQQYILFNIDGRRVNNGTNYGDGVFLVRKKNDRISGSSDK
jgi:hypothetical protein